jgi:hypothetical protein
MIEGAVPIPRPSIIGSARMDRFRATLIARAVVCVAVLLALAACSAGAKRPLTWGVYVPDDGAPSGDLDVVTAMAGDEPDYVLRFASLPEDVPIALLDRIAKRGATPLLTLEPWLPTGGPDQPDYALSTIVSGAHDADLERWARALAAWDRPILLRFAHEMNGDWYPWSVGRNGNTAAQFVAAWDHMHDVFTSAGADKVELVWAPNVPLKGQVAELGDLYPGPASVDVLGIDGYNGLVDGAPWLSPAELLGPGLDELRRLPGEQPILVTETATAEGARSGADKADWIHALVNYLGDADRVVGFVWFQAAKERDWRFNSTAEAEKAMRDALANRGG